MQMTALSPTKLETARLCLARLKAKYSDYGDYTEEQGEPAKIGTLAHAAAKIWYRGSATHNDKTTVLVNTPDVAFTEAMLECAETKDFNGNPNSQLPMEPSGIDEARTMFNAIVAHYPRENLKVLYAERKYKGTLANGVPVSLIIDLIVDNGNGVCEVIDFKTGFLSCSTDEMYDKDQVLMNLVAVSQDPDLMRFPTKQFTYYWVKKGFVTGPIHLPLQTLADYENWLALRYQEILNTEDPPETLNRFCKNCGRKTECKKYTAFLAEAYGVTNPQDIITIKPEDVKALTDEDLMAQADRMAAQMKMLEGNVDNLKEELKGRLEAAATKEIFGDRYKATLRQDPRSSYRTETVLSLAQQYGVNIAPLVSIKKKEVDTAFSSIPAAQQALEMTMHRGATAPWVAINGNTKRTKPKK